MPIKIPLSWYLKNWSFSVLKRIFGYSHELKAEIFETIEEEIAYALDRRAWYRENIDQPHPGQRLCRPFPEEGFGKILAELPKQWNMLITAPKIIKKNTIRTRKQYRILRYVALSCPKAGQTLNKQLVSKYEAWPGTLANANRNHILSILLSMMVYRDAAPDFEDIFDVGKQMTERFGSSDDPW